MKQLSQGLLAIMAAFLACVFLIPMAAAANGAQLEYYGVETSISEDMTVKTSVNIRFAEPVESFEYPLAYKIFNLTAEASFDSAQCDIFEGKDSSRILCKLNGITAKNNLLTLSFYSTGSIKESRSKFSFSADYTIPFSAKDSFILIKIPKNSVLSEDPPNQSYSPPEGKILSDGKYIMVYWQKENLAVSQELKFSVSYAVPISSGAYSNLMIISVAAIVIISMISVAIYVRRGSIYTKSTTQVIASVLNSDENKIVDILTKHGGKSGQKIIVRESDFSKAKVSRLVKNLKERGVVDIEPISGRENRVILKFEKRAEPEQTESQNTEIPGAA